MQGTDLSPIQPQWVPPNLKFVVDDCESTWPEDEHSSYDFVHGRSMSGSIANWSALFTEVFQALRPGGWLEMQEFDVWFRSEEGDLPADSKIAEWQNYLDQASLMFGKRLNVANEFKEKIIAVGFEDVRDDIIKVRYFPRSGVTANDVQGPSWILAKRPKTERAGKMAASADVGFN